MKGNVNVDCDVSIYSEILFIFITELRPVNLFKMVAQKCWTNPGQTKERKSCINQMWASKAKDELNTNMFTEWQPARVLQIYLPKTRAPGILSSFFKTYFKVKTSEKILQCFDLDRSFSSLKK